MAPKTDISVKLWKDVRPLQSLYRALALSPQSCTWGQFVACGRENGQIEIRSLDHHLMLEKFIPGAANSSLEALCWVHQPLSDDQRHYHQSRMENGGRSAPSIPYAPLRLFSTGLHGYIDEWDLARGIIKHTTQVGPHPIYCMAVDSTQTYLAVGCKAGFVTVYEIQESGLVLNKILNHPEGHGLRSLAWGVNRRSVLAGDARGMVVEWDAAKGMVMGQFSPARARGVAAGIWTLLPLPDNMVAVGTASGELLFYETVNHTLVSQLHLHDGDITALAASVDYNYIYTGGLDHKLVTLVRDSTFKSNNGQIHQAQSTNGTDNPLAESAMYVGNGMVRFSNNAIQALAAPAIPDFGIVTAGVRLLVMPNDLSMPMARYVAPVLPCFSVAHQRCWGLFHYRNTFELWDLGGPPSVRPAPIQGYILGQGRFPISPLRRATVDQGQRNLPLVSSEPAVQPICSVTLSSPLDIIASDISADGQWAAVSDVEQVRLFHLNVDERDVAVSRVGGKFPPVAALPVKTAFRGARHIRFTPDSSRLILADVDSRVSVIDLKEGAKDDGEGSDAEGSMDLDARALTPGSIIHQFLDHRKSPAVTTQAHTKYDYLLADRLSIANNATAIGSAATGDPGAQIQLMAVSDDGQWLATADDRRVVRVFNLHTFTTAITLVRHVDPCTALGFDPTQSHLILSFVSRATFVYDLATKDVVKCFSAEDLALVSGADPDTSDHKARRKAPFTGIAVNPAASGDIILWNVHCVTRVKLSRTDDDSQNAGLNGKRGPRPAGLPTSRQRRKAGGAKVRHAQLLTTLPFGFTPPCKGITSKRNQLRSRMRRTGKVEEYLYIGFSEENRLFGAATACHAETAEEAEADARAMVDEIKAAESEDKMNAGVGEDKMNAGEDGDADELKIVTE
ncbi:U3 small nucleolar RNA-associated protein [Tieghemiomyces parasiticus]|uniref:U3 small nucleolar RNA-associated protein n=1 Tax=Tieghemiomyces parasiticus TaxID=78921 RepID=A0A9W8AFV6_9FUNG|nr:U3 small nucleolar RNA-associated protein [Tieghemiomyces parasiticus]